MAAVVTGGATRAESVRAALAEVPDDALVVLVHDAARPLVDDAVIERVLAPLAEGVRRRRARAFRSPTRSSASRRASSPRRSTARRSSPCRRRRRSLRPSLRAAYRGDRADRRRRTARRWSRQAAAGSASSRATCGCTRSRRRPTSRSSSRGSEGRLLRRRRDPRRRGALVARAGRAARRLQPHVVWAALGVTIERGEEHNELWRHLGIERPTTWVARALVRARRPLSGRHRVPRVGSVPSGCASASSATRRQLLERWAQRRGAPGRCDLVVGEPRRREARPALLRARRRARRLRCAARLPTSAIGSTTTFSRPLPPGSSRSTSGVGRGACCNATPPEAAFGVDDLASLPEALASLL